MRDGGEEVISGFFGCHRRIAFVFKAFALQRGVAAERTCGGIDVVGDGSHFGAGADIHGGVEVACGDAGEGVVDAGDVVRDVAAEQPVDDDKENDKERQFAAEEGGDKRLACGEDLMCRLDDDGAECPRKARVAIAGFAFDIGVEKSCRRIGKLVLRYAEEFLKVAADFRMKCGWRAENRAVLVCKENIAVVSHAHKGCDIDDAATEILGEGFAVEGGLQKTVAGLECDADVTGLGTAVGFRLKRLRVLFLAVKEPQEFR